MPDYRIYKSNGKGGLEEVTIEEFGKFLGLTPYDSNIMVKGINIVKAICIAVGLDETPELIWNDNMPEGLIKFVTENVAGNLEKNPAWDIQDFDWSLLYEDGKLKWTNERKDG